LVGNTVNVKYGVFSEGCVQACGNINTLGKYLSGGIDLFDILTAVAMGCDTSGAGFGGRRDKICNRYPSILEYNANGLYNSYNLGYDGNLISPTSNDYTVSIGGVIQTPGIDFCISSANNGTIIFAEPPPSSNIVSIYANEYDTYMSSRAPKYTLFCGDGLTTDFAIGKQGNYYGTNLNGYEVVVDGIMQRPGVDYFASSLDCGIIRFTTPPPYDTPVLIKSINYNSYPSLSSSQYVSDGSSTCYAILSGTVYTSEACGYVVTLDGVLQRPGTDYTVDYANCNIVLSEPAPEQTSISIYPRNYGCHLLEYGQINAPVVTKLCGTGNRSFYEIGTTGNFSGVDNYRYMVTVDGLIQRPAIDWCADTYGDGSICFTNPPAANSNISVYSYNYREDYQYPSWCHYQGDGVCSLYPAASGMPFENYNTNSCRYLVAVGGVLQRPDLDYCGVGANIQSANICFSTPPPSGVPVSIYTYNFVGASIISPGYVASTLCAPTLSYHTSQGCGNLALGPNDGFFGLNSCNYLITVGGVIQTPDVDFYAHASGNGSICFTTPPPSGVDIAVFAYRYLNGAKANKYTNTITTFTDTITASDQYLTVVDGPNTRYVRVWDNK
jgi:hypothetical protein